MLHSRRSGILLHPTSLPGPYGSGDFGKNAYQFIDWLKSAQQSLWQMLPLVDTGVGNSPYMSTSAFAGNALLIDLEQLKDAGWLDDSDLPFAGHFDEYRVDFAKVIPFRMSRLRIAANRFFADPDPVAFASYSTFCKNESAWLDDYALFRTLDAMADEGSQWQNWEKDLVRRCPVALQKTLDGHAEEIRFWKFCQWCFEVQWLRLKKYANENGIDVIGDVPLFVSLHSADVWARPELFQLDSNGQPTVVAGVPPDAYSPTGQRWGNPLYDWSAIAKDGYRWWISRMAHAMRLFDIVRVDHFRGLESYWEVPADALTALDGVWKKGPGADFFNAMNKALDNLNIIAEDLGDITPAVIELRKAFELPGMCILHFAFDRDPNNLYLPHNIEKSSVIYTGTHDNDTTIGWWNSLSEYERDYVRRFLAVSGEWIHWDMIRAAFASVANFAVIPMQDVLGLSGEYRMNKPGEASGQWEWRFSNYQISEWHATYLSELTWLYGRQHSLPVMPETDTAQETGPT